jgi:cysteinyl-tRNA synthetase
VTDGHQLRLYNSLGRQVEDFVPSADPSGMYSCGPTVYAFPHLGNMRAYVFADTVRRALRWKEIRVRHVVNITDVGHAVADTDTGEDKVEVAAARERRSVEEIAEFYTRAFFDDIEALNILPAAEYPRASAYVGQMIEFAATLEARGYTYRLPSGLYFDTAKDPRYGELAQLHAEGQREAARLEQVPGRRRKTDFALWRAEQPGRRRVMRWDSPWGWGAPGWHLECSVMSIALLGPHFDIHTGGVDHRELHHVNEIAQSEAYLGDGQPWVRFWLHNEFLQLGAAKMAKSAGGAPRLADLTSAGYHPMALRLFLLGGHYRSQLDFTIEALDAAQATLRRLVARIQPLRPLPAADTLDAAAGLLARPTAAAGSAAAAGPAAAAGSAAAAGPVGQHDPAAADALDLMDAAISADLSTPKILAALQDALRDPAITQDGLRTLTAAADALLGLGLATLDPADLEQRRSAAELAPEELHAIERLVAERTQARKERDWARADRIRAQLEEQGVEVTDTPEGPVWQLR